MSKLQIHTVKGNSGYITGHNSIGVYFLNSTSVLLIDSGIDSDTAKQVQLTLSTAGYCVAAIINTHHHPDHCGGNAFFQKLNPSLHIYATHHEKIFIENPTLVPAYFCCGSAPYKSTQTKYLETKPSKVTHCIDSYEDQGVEILGTTFKIVILQGHTPGMIGIITPDNILYCGDAIFGKETYTKHSLLFYTNIEDTLITFKKLYNLDSDGCVFYHNGFLPNIKEIIPSHEQKVLEVKNSILEFIKVKSCSEGELLQYLIKKLNIPENIIQYVLTRTCINAYLTLLEKENRIKIIIANGLLEFHSL